MEEFKPGQVIIPQQPDEPAPSASASLPSQEMPAVPAQAAVPPAAPAAVAESAPVQVSEPVWNYTPQNDPGFDDAATVDILPLPDEISWTASEFIAHDKSAGWYMMLATGSLVAAVVVFLLTKDKISTAIIILAALAFGVFAARKPKTQQYSLTSAGLHIGAKVYSFDMFKTFSVTEDGVIASIVLMPLKRFMPPLTAYVAPDSEAKVVDFLSAFLPYQEHKADAVDSLLKKIRF